MKERVVVAMSGGVDSSVAAALLKEQGYEVIGVTMCFNLADRPGKKPGCCGLQGIEDARRVAHKLGIKHYVLNMQKALQEKVIEDFCQEYLLGRTPNPCVRCNQYLKFDALLKKALSLGAEYLATGHYARVVKIRNPKSEILNYALKKAKDKKKDQSYFLYRITQSQLKHILFPLGDYTKDEVRELARKFYLPVADKIASQEICFIPDMDYRKFLEAYLGRKMERGLVVDKFNNALGYHKGVAFYTIGQREGIGIAYKYPLYITNIDPKENKITLSGKEDVFKKEFFIKEPHFISGKIQKKVALKVKIRYNHKEVPACVISSGRRIKVRFDKPQFAITPGQSAVFYNKDILVGGGIIDEVLM